MQDFPNSLFNLKTPCPQLICITVFDTCDEYVQHINVGRGSITLFRECLREKRQVNSWIGITEDRELNPTEVT